MLIVESMLIMHLFPIAVHIILIKSVFLLNLLSCIKLAFCVCESAEEAFSEVVLSSQRLISFSLLLLLMLNTGVD